MRRFFGILLAFSIAAGICVAAPPKIGLSIQRLRCEYLTDPLGIDVEKPRLSWTLVSSRPVDRGQFQSAYRILVASSLERLQKDKGDAWDSGKVNLDQSTFVVYAGLPLNSGIQYWWKVRLY